MVNKLGLDEALISINRSAIVEPLELYYQIEECYGCKLDKLERLDADGNFIIGTKYGVKLELRGQNNTSNICKLEKLNLNNHGHYRLDVAKASPPNGSYDCSLVVLEKGDCLFCPIAILVSLIFVITLIEKLYSRVALRRRIKGRKISVDNREVPHQDEESEEEQQHQGGVGQPNETAHQSNNGQTKNQSKRVVSLDAFRGLTIAGMIMVNYGGAGYSILEHKPWDGLTLADLVFPFFIFSMGASIAISTRSMIEQRKSFDKICRKVCLRSLTLLALGLCLNSKWLNGRSLNYLRLTGVLQRFAGSYLIVALIYTIEVMTNKWIKAQSLYRIPFLSRIFNVLFEFLAAVNFLAIYIYVTFYLNYSQNCPMGYTGPGGQTEGGKNLNCTGGAAAWLDRTLIGEQHLYNDTEVRHVFKTPVSHDPEGLLGYATSILLTLLGLQCGKILIYSKGPRVKLVFFSQWIVLLALASILVILIPINKRLWSLTFVTVTGACAFITITSLYLILDIYQCQRGFFLRLLISAGKNAIFLYVGHSLLDGMLPWYFAVDESSHLQLLLRLSWSTLVWLLIAHYMASKRVFIRI